MKPRIHSGVTLVRVSAARNSCELRKCGIKQLGAADAVFAVAWSPAQEVLVATGGGDDRAFLWQVGRRTHDQQSSTASASVLAGAHPFFWQVAMQVGAEQGSAEMELGSHSDSVSSASHVRAA